MSISFLFPELSATQTIIDRNKFLFEANKKWPGSRVLRWGEGERQTDVDIIINPDDMAVTVSHFRDNKLISADGALDFEEAANIAVWVRSLNPDPNLVLWFTTSVFDGHTVLTPGITQQQVIDQWVDHREHDPYFEYPQYFQ
ncbi:hypothetical protein [Actinomyces stomatis]|uniref:hypothetical protein n=1 Tax=Actinomyces stomatis TaxID=3050227 RepID=UPI002852547F|nr:hypothetical protein [Actinomyces sp. PK606]